MPFWKMIKEGYDHFEVTRQEPKVDFCEKKYVFDAVKAPNAKRDPVFEASAKCPAYAIPDEVAGYDMLYSSGTTGRPKGVKRQSSCQSVFSTEWVQTSVNAAKSEALRKKTDGRVIRSKRRSNPTVTTRINKPYFIRPFSL